MIKRSVPSEDADEENPVVSVYLSELFVKTQPTMTKSVSKYTGRNILDLTIHV